MQKLYTAEQVKRMDQAAIAAGTPGAVLMKRAGRAAFSCILESWPTLSKLIVICGAGNNAGDGYVVAALARQAAISVDLYYTAAPNKLTAEAADAVRFAAQEGVVFQSADKLFETPLPQGNAIIVDALLGTGVRGPLKPMYADLIRWINARRSPVFSVDVPSGLSVDTGTALNEVVCADKTLTFIGQKRGLWTGQGKEVSGKVYFDDLCVESDAAFAEQTNTYLLEVGLLRHQLHKPVNSHKGNFGHVAIIGGDHGMGGAALLAAEASVYSGAGITSMYSRAVHVTAANIRVPEVMAHGLEDDANFEMQLSQASVVAVGPGLGQSDWSKVLLKDTFSLPIAKVIDADALNLIASGFLSLPADQQYILTPHPGEAARMLNVRACDIQRDRFESVRQLQQRYGGIIVLKGAGTLIADSESIFVCPRGNAGMAVGGMGDVLAGCIAAMVAQGFCLLDAAKLGVWAHSVAADNVVMVQGEIGLKASDLFPSIRSCLNGKIN